MENKFITHAFSAAVTIILQLSIAGCTDSVNKLQPVQPEKKTVPQVSTEKSFSFQGEITLPRMKINKDDEDVYGVEYEACSEKSSATRPTHIRLYGADGKMIESLALDSKYGEIVLNTKPEWQTGRVEFMSRKGTCEADIIFNSMDKIELKKLRLVKGGFQPNSIFKPAPYISWINSLKPNMEYAQENLLMKKDAEINPREKRTNSIWFYWLKHIVVSPETIAGLKDDVSPYMKLSVKELIALMPDKRPFNFSYGGDRKPDEFSWTPSAPDMIKDKNGEVFDFKTKYPVTGYEKAIGVDGKTSEYAYHESGKSDGKYGKYTINNRIYLDQFLETVKLRELCRTAYNMSVLYKATGEKDYALKSAAIMWALSSKVYSWPVFGRKGNAPLSFMKPDSYCYDEWMAFILSFANLDEHNEVSWYMCATYTLIWPARNFDMIKTAPDSVWKELSSDTSKDPRADIAEALLYMAKQSLKKDAYMRNSPWNFYHNTLAGQLKGLSEIGQAVGCPDLVHYSVMKADATLKHTMTADYMFPESPSYLEELLAGFNLHFELLTGYSDPKGYMCSLDSTRYDNFKSEKYIPFLFNGNKVLSRLKYPDGTFTTFHDTWSNTTAPLSEQRLEDATRTSTESYLLPDFGHAIQGRGADSDCIESHLHYSLSSTHLHLDMLNFTLWAYGDELASDIGYSHLGLYRYETSAHNLVVINGTNQENVTKERGDLLAWYDEPGAAQVMQAAQGGISLPYKMAEKYRRSVITIPFAPGKDAVVDIFEVKGGNRHEWMANGCADYAQTVKTDLETVKTLDNLADDGKAVTKQLQSTTGGLELISGKKSAHYGAFRNVKVCENKAPWQVTMEAAPAVPEGTPGAGPRAVSKDEKPGLRINWLYPNDGQVFIAEAPRNRYSKETANEKAAEDAWPTQTMPKIIVRKDGENIESRFVAVWEPFMKTPWLTNVKLLKDIPTENGTGVYMEGKNASATVLYRIPEKNITLETGKISSDAVFTIFKNISETKSISIYHGTKVTVDNLKLEIAPSPQFPVIGQGADNGEPYLTVKGKLDGYPVKPEDQPHGGKFIHFIQTNNCSRWLPLKRVEQNPDGTCKLVFSRDPGFSYDGKNKTLVEKFFPFRILQGDASVELPSTLNMSWAPAAAGKLTFNITQNTDITLALSGFKNIKSAKLNNPLKKENIDLPMSKTGDGILVSIPVNLTGKGKSSIIIDVE